MNLITWLKKKLGIRTRAEKLELKRQTRRRRVTKFYGRRPRRKPFKTPPWHPNSWK